MKTAPEAPAVEAPSRLQQMVQRLADDYQARDDRVSHELYENIAQSLVAIRTQLALMEKKRPSTESPEMAAWFRQVEVVLQATLDRVRELADGLYAPALAGLSLEASLEALCLIHATRTQTPARFEDLLSGRLPPWVGHAHGICLHYFVEQALRYAEAGDGPVSVCLGGDTDAIFTVVRFESGTPAVGHELETGLPLLEEWLGVWGGRLVHSNASDAETTLAAWLGPIITPAGAAGAGRIPGQSSAGVMP